MSILDLNYELSSYRGRPRRSYQAQEETVRTLGKKYMFLDAPGGLFDRIKLVMANDTFECFAIWGRKGAGKSTCSLWLGWRSLDYFYNKYLHSLNPLSHPKIEPDKIWDMVLDHVVFKATEFFRVIDSYEGGSDHHKRCPFICIDDAGLNMHKYFWSETDNKNFSAFMNVARVKLKFMIFSAPALKHLMTGLRQNLITGEIWVYAKPNYKTDPPSLQKGFGFFISYEEYPDFKRIGEEYERKKFVEGGYGKPFTFPEVPRDIKERYERKKMEAIRDALTLFRVLRVREKSYIKALTETLTPLEIEILKLLNSFGESTFGEDAMRQKVKEVLGVNIPEYKVHASLMNLRAKDLVYQTSEGFWKATERGLSVSEHLATKDLLKENGEEEED